VGKRDHPEEANHERQGRYSKSQCCSCHRCHRDAGGDEQSSAPAKWTELRHESKSIVRVADAHARDEWQPHADMVAVLYHDVVEPFQLGFEKLEIGVQGFHDVLTTRR